MQTRLFHQNTALDGSNEDSSSQTNFDLLSALPGNDISISFELATNAPAPLVHSTSSATTTTTNTVSFAGSGIVFNNTFAANVSQAYKNCILAAEQTIASEWTNPITLNLTFDAEALGTNTFNAENSAYGDHVSYSTLKAALTMLASEEPNNIVLQQAVATLPIVDPSAGAGFTLYGLLYAATSPGAEPTSTITLNTSLNWLYGQDVTDSMLHEITEGAMGRVGGLGDQNGHWGVMDLFRYNSSGVRDYTDGRDGQSTYFSYNGGVTLSSLSFNNEYNSSGTQVNVGDVADFLPGTDIFGGLGPGGTLPLSSTDLQIMDALGWSTGAWPSVSSISAMPDTKIAYATTGHLLTITVTLSAVVTVSGIPTLQLNDYEVATYANGSGSNTLTFTYAVQVTDTTTDLQVTGLNLPSGASIAAVAGNSVTGSITADLAIQVNTPSAPIAEQISEIYEAVLQRAPASSEVTSQLALAGSNGVAAVISSVVDSTEALFNVYPVVQIIKLALGNLPTAHQLAGWVPFIESNGLLDGQSQSNPLLDEMALAFVASGNFGKFYNNGVDVNPNSTVTAQEMQVIIQAATGKAATPAQVANWVATGLTIDQVFVDFALGDQYTAFLQNTVQQFLITLADLIPNDGMTVSQVQGAYQAVLQRAPTNGEISAALSIDSTIGNVAAVAAIVDSPEAQQYVYPVTQIILLATGNLPTAGQLAGWVPAVESGTSLDQMALAFVASTAFGETYNGGTAVDPDATITASIVSAIIEAATGIAATQTQINAWLGTGQTIDQVFVDFALGDQYTGAIQGTVQNYLTAAAINGAGLSTVDGINATGALTLGTAATPLTGNDLTVQGGSGSLTVVATGNGDTITELNTATAGGTITANGNTDIINAANGANTITANGAGDTINIGVVSTGTSITAAQTIHAAGAGDVITFATQAADSTAVTWGAASTVDGGNATTGIGANSTVNFGTNTAGGSEAIVITGDLTGATTQNGTTTTGIAMITLGNVHDAAGDQIIFNNATTEVLAGTSAVNVTGASLAQAFDLAAAAAATSQGGTIAAHTGVIDWFQFNGNTYVLEAINNTSSSAVHSALEATDTLVKVMGLVSLSGESLSAHTLTL